MASQVAGAWRRVSHSAFLATVVPRAQIKTVESGKIMPMPFKREEWTRSQASDTKSRLRKAANRLRVHLALTRLQKPQPCSHFAQLLDGRNIQPPAEMLAAITGQRKNDRLGGAGRQHMLALGLFEKA
jgi:hypothetical protein